MMHVYVYHSIRIARGGWRQAGDGVRGGAGAAVDAGGSVYGFFAGIIGLANDEGIVMTAWPDAEAAMLHSSGIVRSMPGIAEETCERLVPSVRPIDATPPREPGVYAHRWFWLQPQDWPEFVALSEEGVWPYFESDGCGIAGLWRSIEPGQPAKALLITRYPSVAHWERTRLLSLEPPHGANERLYRQAQTAARRRSELTERSIVRLTTLVPQRSG